MKQNKNPINLLNIFFWLKLYEKESIDSIDYVFDLEFHRFWGEFVWKKINITKDKFASNVDNLYYNMRSIYSLFSH